MSPFDIAHTTSYWRSIATLGLSRTLFRDKRRFKSKTANFPDGQVTSRTALAGVVQVKTKSSTDVDKPWSEDRCTQFRVIVVTDPQTNKHTHPQTHTQTHRHDRVQYTAPLSLARSVITCNCVLWCIGQLKKLVTVNINQSKYNLIQENMAAIATYKCKLTLIVQLPMSLNDLCHISYWKYPRINISEESTFHLSADRQA